VALVSAALALAGPVAGPGPAAGAAQIAAAPAGESAGGSGGSAMAVVAAMRPGWNLGNSLDATGSDETSWGNPVITEALLDNVRRQGFRSIRIPVTWGHHQGGAPDYAIEPGYLARVREVVGWALADGFYVLLNMHHDSWLWVADMPAQHDAVLARYTAAWRQIAAAFRDAPGRLLLESINEPSFNGGSGDAGNAALLHELNTAFHREVRGSGGANATRKLVLPTLHTSADQARLDELAATFAALNDPNLIATVHFYGFWPFSVNVAGFTRFDATTQQDLVDVFDRAYNAFVARGIPVIIGEYGLLGFDRHTGTVEQGEKLKFFEYLGWYARERRLTTMLWDNGQHFDRTAFRWRDEALYRQIRSSWTTRSGTASTDQLFVDAAAPVTDRTVTLNLNGTALTGVYHGRTRLRPGRDVTLDGDRLTVTAAALTRLVGDRAYGVNAQLSARFSSGVPWTFNVISHATPVLGDAVGTSASLEIPAAFNGDQVATMEARYADGTNAGPHGWTSYKEFDVTFAPDYAANRITLRSAFFAEVTDGTVHLTFHFWSGATVGYTLTRAGDTVTGSAG
jgi:aryl-phospho-beta-D-glucosidase BglC (GH1 family)